MGRVKKQNKWDDPFYAYARCQKSGRFPDVFSKWLKMKRKRSPLKG